MQLVQPREIRKFFGAVSCLKNFNKSLEESIAAFKEHNATLAKDIIARTLFSQVERLRNEKAELDHALVETGKRMEAMRRRYTSCSRQLELAEETFEKYAKGGIIYGR